MEKSNKKRHQPLNNANTKFHDVKAGISPKNVLRGGLSVIHNPYGCEKRAENEVVCFEWEGFVKFFSITVLKEQFNRKTKGLSKVG